MRALAFSALLLATAVPAAANAKTAQCHDAAGHFVKCSAPGAMAVGAATASAPATPISAAPAANAKAPRCKDARGHFAKCGTPMASAAAMAPAAAAAPNTAMTPARPAMATAASPAMAPGATPAGATAKCKDGTYSHSAHHSGSCSRHGGVATFL